MDYTFANYVGDMTETGCSRAQEILQTGRDFEAELRARDASREKCFTVHCISANVINTCEMQYGKVYGRGGLACNEMDRKTEERARGSPNA